MARIYNPERYEGEFTPSAQSRGFNPVQAVDNSDKERQKAEQRLRNLSTQETAMKRQQRLDSGVLKAQQGIAQANMERNNTVVKGILQLSETAVKGFEVFNEYQQEQEKERIEQEQFDALFGTEFSFSQTSDKVDELVDQENDATAQAVALQQGAVKTTDDPQVVEEIVGPSADAQASNSLRGLTTQTFGMMAPTLIAEALQSERIITRPDGSQFRAMDADNIADTQLVAQLALREGASAVGLANMDPRTARQMLGQQLGNAFSQQVTAHLNRVRKGRQESRAQAHLDNASGGIFAGATDTASLQQSFTDLADGLWTSGAYETRRQANEAAVTHLINQLKANKDEDGLKALLNVNKIANNKGTSLGITHVGAVQDAIRAVKSGEIQDARTERAQQQLTIEDAQLTLNNALLVAETPEQIQAANQAYEATLRNIPGLAATEALQAAERTSDSYSPFAYGDLLDRAAAGEDVTQEAKDLLSMGVISADEAKTVIDQSGGEAAAIAKPYKAEWRASVEGAVREQLGSSAGFADVSNKEFVSIVNDMDERLNAHMQQWIKENGEAATPGNIRVEKDRYLLQIAQKQLGNVQLVDGVITGYNYAGQSQKDVKVYQNPVTGQPARVYSNLTTTQIKELSNKDADKDNDVNIYSDRLIRKEELAAGIEVIRSGNLDNFSARVRYFAEAAGVTPREIIYGQAIGQGIDIIELTKPVSPKSGGPAGPQNAKEGMVYLQSQGFTRAGAAYISGSIQAESSWNGTRSWGEVAGDGTFRNGGLISWASWANAPARLGKAEAYIGKPIEQATHAEQMEFMIYEMRTSYPNAYRVFRNPNATPAQLRRASYEWIGYGIEGNRYQVANELLGR